jgi:NADH dehydrogenase FAD-containing subunit
MTVMTKLGEFRRRGHRVTLISPSPHHYYSGMGPGVLGGTYSPEQIRFPIRRIVEVGGADYVDGVAEQVDPERRTGRLMSGDEIGYDVVSFNTGSYVPIDSFGPIDGPVYPVKPIEALLEGQKHLLQFIQEKVPSILVVGGGPAGVEVAGNIWRLVRVKGGSSRITVVERETLLRTFPERARRFVLESLTSRGIEVMENAPVAHIRKDHALLKDDRTIPCDIAFLAHGIRPSDIFRTSGIRTDTDGALPVNRFLQGVDHPELFGGGDCIGFQERPLDRVGVYAVRQNPILYHNLMAALEERSFIPYKPQKRYVLIFNMGDGRGVFWRNGWVRVGRPWFWLKDSIDRRFMRKYRIIPSPRPPG